MSCASQKKTNTPTHTTNTSTSNKILDISYEARSRGGSKTVHILENVCTYKTRKENRSITLSSEERKNIIKAISKIDLEKMKTLKSPTNKRISDGAMHATLKVKEGTKQYNSSNFDDGYPPAELKSLVDLLMKIVE